MNYKIAYYTALLFTLFVLLANFYHLHLFRKWADLTQDLITDLKAEQAKQKAVTQYPRP